MLNIFIISADICNHINFLVSNFFNNINKCKLFINVMSSCNINNNQLILEGLIRAMPQLTERNQLM